MLSPIDPAAARAALDRLLPAIHRSLAAYLSDAKPWVPAGCEALGEAALRVAADHRLYSQRLVETIRELGGIPHFGRFPARYTSIHDIDCQHAAAQIVAELHGLLPLLEQCAAATAGVACARELVDEILQSTRGQIELLEGLSAPQSLAP